MTPPTRESVERIMALCEAVPQKGPWFVCERPNDDGTSNIETGRIGDWNPAQNCEHPCADFIAACDPQTIFALCAENKRLTAEVERLRGEGKPIVTIRKTPIMDRFYGLNYLPRNWANKLPVGDTPLYAHSTSAAAEGAVTDAMVRAAREAWLSMDVPAEIEVNPANDDMVFDVHLRAALRAALAAAPGEERK